MRAHEEKHWRLTVEQRDRINAGARELRRLGAVEQFADRPGWAYVAFSMAAVFDTVAIHIDEMPYVLVSDALRACRYLLEPLPGDRRTAEPLDQS
ncbi:hypothetical protein [Pseudonocardia dioxanivorans]|uniref:hypothetical protein n=1 Tax=Pseudonocardia dioxanivorans TaxID=240495 RepID=UPI000CD0CB2A|nr:hypothetical protein [Pseudonocardia dioxanivorans]